MWRLSATLRATAGSLLVAVLAVWWSPTTAQAEPAKLLFGSKPLPSKMRARAEGFYSKGCLAGGMAIPIDGPTWQVMRLSRNRRWGHPDLIALLEELSIRAKADGWNGLMIGDISQPRGGPMLTGHLSHQVGLDADLWFMPMPQKRLTFQEREDTSAISVLKSGTNYVDDKNWTKAHERVLFHAANFDKVQRILVHPGVKKKLCDTVSGDRTWLSKIRPFYGHHYHFHIRLYCPSGSPGCKPQNAVGSATGCDESLDWWFDVALKPKKPKKSDGKPSKRREIGVADLPEACRMVLNAADRSLETAEFRTRTPEFTAPKIELPEFDHIAVLTSKPIEAKLANDRALTIPVPTPRPAR